MRDESFFDNAPWETIHGQIIGKANNYQAVPDGCRRSRIIKNDRIRAYERHFREQCRIYAGAMVDRPFEVVVIVYTKSWSFDLDNSLKTLLDCMQDAGVITDDKNCIRIVADKVLDPYNPRIEFCVLPQPPQPSLFGSSV